MQGTRMVMHDSGVNGINATSSASEIAGILPTVVPPIPILAMEAGQRLAQFRLYFAKCSGTSLRCFRHLRMFVMFTPEE